MLHYPEQRAKRAILVRARSQGDVRVSVSPAVKYVGLMFERWFFFTQANQLQNLYYRTD